MENIKQSLGKAKKLPTGEVAENDLLNTVIEAVKDKKGANIVSLDLRKIDEAVADFFILCEAGSKQQVKAICDNVEKCVREICEERPYHIQEGENWTLIDYVNIVLHIFKEEERKFYDLEGLWLDGKRTDYAS